MLGSLLTSFTSLLLAPALIVSSLFTPAPDLGAALPQAVAIFETSLAAPITSSATSMTLAANSVRGGGALSGYNCFTIDEGSSQAEFVCGTVSGTSVTAMTRGISPLTGTTTDSDVQFSHRRGASVKITDFPVLQILKAQLNGEDTIENPISYGSGVSTSTLNQSGKNLATVEYVNGVAFNGAAVADATAGTKGVSELATGAEAAASTANGSSGALVLPASIASSSRSNSGASNLVVVTDSNGYIDDDFLPRTIASTTAFTATTTIQGYPVVNHIVYASTTATSTTNNSGVDTIYSVTIPGGTLSSDGGIRFDVDLTSFTGNASERTIFVNYGGATLGSFITNGTLAQNVNTGKGKIEFTILARSSAAAQIGFGTFSVTGATATTTIIHASSTTSVVNSAVDQTFAIQQDWGSGSGTATFNNALIRNLR